MQTRLIATAVAFAAVLSGCSMLYRVRPGQSRPATAVVDPEQRAAIWQRAVTVLLDEGYIPELLNESVCFISARRRADLVDDALAGTLVLIAISPEGNLRVEVGGSGIFHVRDGDKNLSVIIETLTRHGTQTIMAQRFLPEIVDGDKRVLVIGGKPVPFCLARIPQGSEVRGNLAAGGKGVARPISARDRRLHQRRAPLATRAVAGVSVGSGLVVGSRGHRSSGPWGRVVACGGVDRRDEGEAGLVRARNRRRAQNTRV